MQLLRTPIIAVLAPLLGLGWAADASGCGKQPASMVNGTTEFNVTSGGLSRSYYVHVPGNYDMNKQYPVVLAFHGSGETAQQLELDTRLSDPKWSPNTIMVYPQGVNSTWAGASYANSTIPEDLQFVDDLLSDMAPKYCIDTNRLYATGFSNGGGFVNILACSANSAGAKFAAFVSASGAYYQEELWNSTLACNPVKLPTPIALIAGKNDSVVYYNGGDGEGGVFPAVPSVVDKWVDRNHCTSLVTTASDNNTVHVSSWTCAGVQDSLVFYEEDDMDHVWASQTQTFSQFFRGESPTKLEANQIIMDFFSKFTLDKEQAAETTSAYTAPSSLLLPYTQASGSSPVPTASASITGSGTAGTTTTTTTGGSSPSQTISKAGAPSITAVAGLLAGLLPLGAAIALL